MNDERKVYWKKGVRKMINWQYFSCLDYIEGEITLTIIICPKPESFNRELYHTPRELLTNKESFIVDIMFYTILKIDTLIEEAVKKDVQSRKISRTSVILDTRFVQWNRKIKNKLEFTEKKRQRTIVFRNVIKNVHEVEIFIYPYTPNKEEEETAKHPQISYNLDALSVMYYTDENMLINAY